MKTLLVLTLLFCANSATAQGPAPSADADRAIGQEYDEFRRSVEMVITKGTSAAASDAERDDIRSLQFMLRELDQHLAAKDWKRAAETKNRMQVALARSKAVAADGPNRKAQQDRLDAERRHREELKQRERQRQEDKENPRAAPVGLDESAGSDEPIQVTAHRAHAGRSAIVTASVKPELSATGYASDRQVTLVMPVCYFSRRCKRIHFQALAEPVAPRGAESASQLESAVRPLGTSGGQ